MPLLPRFLAIGAILSLCGLVQLHAAVEIRVTSGDLITGEVSEETDKTLQIKRTVMIKHQPVETMITVNKSTITSRKEVPSLLEQYNERAEKTPDVFIPQCGTARWCYERALVEQALHHTKIAEKLDSNNPIVAKLYGDLGFIREDNKWITQEDYLVKTGKVSLGGTIMTKEEAEETKAKILVNGSTARLEQQIHDVEWTIKSSEAKIAEYTADRDKAKEEEAKAKADAAGAKNRVEQLSKRVEVRKDTNRQNERTQNRERDDQAAISEANATYSKANSTQKKAERERETAEDKLEKYKALLEKAKKELPELKKQLEEITGKPAEGEEADPAGKKESPAVEKKTEEKAKASGRFGDLK